ncbi:hypothetical protein [Crocosphaera chwakensis]|uniref:Uncharacterized protein n=1 Tax=Crocosphaera chwakensis CCY0110 TaxID=391612 RepID=A3IU61_9CHRO|nr:hypothetical protein [Crocosphaera chwakensis]EAZ90035.1 hypothetical protein CY0110_20870 [Crocosphaera chwakensis CCY0110]
MPPYLNEIKDSIIINYQALIGFCGFLLFTYLGGSLKDHSFEKLSLEEKEKVSNFSKRIINQKFIIVVMVLMVISVISLVLIDDANSLSDEDMKIGVLGGGIFGLLLINLLIYKELKSCNIAQDYINAWISCAILTSLGFVIWMIVI